LKPCHFFNQKVKSNSHISSVASWQASTALKKNEVLTKNMHYEQEAVFPHLAGVVEGLLPCWAAAKKFEIFELPHRNRTVLSRISSRQSSFPQNNPNGVGKTGNTPQNDTTAQQSDAQNHTRIG
jgi:hypothetical protein